MLTLTFIQIVLWFVTLYVHKHTYRREEEREWDSEKKRYVTKETNVKLKTPLWLVVLTFICMLIPILGICLIVVGCIIYIIDVFIEKDYTFKSGRFILGIIRFLNKDI